MEAYVIKNKEGKYLRGVYGKNGETCWTTDIIDAMVYELNEFVPQPIENCILVPITITEGNLEEGTEQLKEQLAEKDREITYLEDCNKSLSNKFDKESDMQNKIDILEYNVEGLEEQLREKDKEIEELKMSVLFEQEHKNKALDELKQLRKQVCDDVYQFIMNHWDSRMGRGIDCYCNTNGRCDKLKEDLEKIAKRSV